MSNVLSRPPTMLSNLPNLLSPPTTTTITSCIFLNQVLERNTKTWKEEEDEEDEESQS